jgi:hypothetical protein
MATSWAKFADGQRDNYGDDLDGRQTNVIKLSDRSISPVPRK